MDFKANKPIYQQIVDFCFSKILMAEWQPEGRVPSVRELAALLVVNPHTVLKAFEYLQAEELIVSKRGMGFYLAKDAVKRVMKLRKKEFFETTLVEMFQMMDLLDVGLEEIVERYKNQKEKKE